MGKSKKRKGQTPHESRVSRILKSNGKDGKNHEPTMFTGKADSKASSQQALKPKIPFDKFDNILLVGEGDFSFALSLREHHRCKHITATSYDTHVALNEKYPNIGSTLIRLRGSMTRTNGDDQTVVVPSKLSAGQPDEWNGCSSSPSPPSAEPLKAKEDTTSTSVSPSEQNILVLHDIDARRLSHTKQIRQRGPFSKILFNFPHVGGITKDVNRQVRLNQELLVSFFKSCLPILASPGRPVRSLMTSRDAYDSDELTEEDHDSHSVTAPSPGYVIVTTFEGEPYSLWNVRDLARHAGYKVVESFKFPWRAYPGYRHARTIGEIKGKLREDGKRSGAWRGEERDARMYIFGVNDGDQRVSSNDLSKTPSRKQDEDSDSDG